MKHSSHSLTRTFMLSMGTFTLWVIFSYLSMLQILTLQEEHKKLTDLSSQLRINTQKSALYSSSYQLNHDKKDLAALRDLIIKMEHDNAFIGTSLSGSKGKGNYLNADVKIKSYLTFLYQFSTTPSTGGLQKIMRDSHDIVKILDGVINSFEKEDKAIIETLYQRQLYILVGTLLTLLLETFFLVRPVIKFLQNYTDNLEEEIKNRTQTVMLYANIFENSNEGMIISEKDSTIIDVNSAFTKITGFTKDDAIGNKANLLKSGAHDKEFYEEMWQRLDSENQWQGEIVNKNKNGQLFNAHLSIVKLYDKASKSLHYLGVFSDITELVQSKNRMRHMATHDTLTGLPNRAFFIERTEHALDIARRSSKGVAIIFIDLDNFKIINDSMGHHVGDRFLIEVANRLKASVRVSDTVARLGGDEFVILLETLNSEEDLQVVVDKVHNSLNAQLTLEAHDFYPAASMGVIYIDKNSEHSDVNTLIRKADMAMYSAKEQGKNRIEQYNEKLDEQIQDHLNVETKLRQAIQDDELELFFQPKVELTSRVMTGAEALLRWQMDDNYIRPDKFIGIAEESELIVDIDMWVCQQALEVLSDWRVGELSNVRLSINLSAKTFSKPRAMKKYISLIAQSDIADKLDIEITENVLMGNLSEAINILNIFKKYGVTTSLDDFGVGYSSFSYLSQMPFDTIKIDRSFILGLNNLKEHDSKQQILIEAIISFSKELGMKVVAEGVENLEQLQWLLDHDCDQGQGYFFNRPMPRGGFEHIYNTAKKPTGDASQKSSEDT